LPYIPIDESRGFTAFCGKEFGKGANWTIDRWNFSYSMSRVMHDFSLQQWEASIGIWESAGNIIGVVNSEGECRGEAFFQVGMANLPEDTLNEMFDFAENNLGAEIEGERFVELRIPAGDKIQELIASNRGYIKQEWDEPFSSLPIIEMQDIILPKGLFFKNGNELNNSVKGMAHAKAFGYSDKEIYVKRVPLCYEAIKQTPDYRADLDLSIVNETGEVVSFSTMWYDAINKLGILEPVGTIPQYRKLNLGRAVIYELINRIKHEGAATAYVGSDQPFYLAIGFTKVFVHNNWKKIL